jgi:4-aminobutyrate aminotransferase/(S)-3-amino-2-methylpropionate transaminase
VEKARALGETLKKTFLEFQEKYDIIGDVRGLGPMIAMELVKDRQTKEPAPEQTKALVSYCYERGIIMLSCGTYGNVIRFLMPLVITDEQLHKGLQILEEGFGALER